MKSVFDEFIETYGSEIWPSTNPNDSPFNKFKCKHCGQIFTLQMFGNFYINEPSFSDKAKAVLLTHLMEHYGIVFLKTVQSTSIKIIERIILEEIPNKRICKDA